ncbi:thiamine pyrophosphate-requiring protein [Roseococcus sp. SYP-B2431]|uniref:thiamine pyrophosphate-requiring protein n=1 Tax=Roseococcus sp. SYP-B2431 TaxID=2496640 RepID=UPI0013F3AE4B|nr:thiamine pyrophosphate-requiring protein [Roseococcus sp. SYP-B2431]
MDHSVPAETTIVAESYLRLLASRGVRYLFGNGGTDFAPIIEAYARAGEGAPELPVPVIVPHENVAVAMAHGYHMVSGELPAVMVHVGLGTANSLNGIYNACRSQIPMLFTAGRTPILEEGMTGARTNLINWAQEMFDQAGMLRELVKWDYELRLPQQVEIVVDRAVALAQSEPRGPVYLTLPREVLAMPAAGAEPLPRTRTQPAVPPRADTAALETLAAWIREAKAPLIITAELGRDPAEVPVLAALAEAAAIPVVQNRPRYLGLPSSHPMACGFDPGALLPEADLVIVSDCDVPWMPTKTSPNPAARIVHLGTDPHFARYPVRGFHADLAITGAAGPALAALHGLLGRLEGPEIDARRAKVTAHHQALLDRAAKVRGEAEAKSPISFAWATHCIDQSIDADTILVNEYPLVLDQLSFETPGSFFSYSPAGGLGWAVGAALGAKLAAPEKTVIATVGDGAYMFSNPTPAHFVSRATDLPILTIVFNNSLWGAVRGATLSVYPDGHASRANRMPLATLDPSPDYEKLVEASGGYGEKVTDPAEVPAALRRALHAVRVERRQAVLNLIVR